MIKTFKDKATERFYNGQRVRQFDGFRDQARRRLQLLDDTPSLEDLRNVRSNRLEALQGSRAGQFSIRINDQWRLCFAWKGQDAYDVEITDYH